MNIKDATEADKIKALAALDGYIWIAPKEGTQGHYEDSEGCWWEWLPDYLTSYDAIILLIQKLGKDVQFRCDFLFKLRTMRCLAIKCGYEKVSDFDSLFNATPEQLANAVLIATGKMTL